MLDAEANTITPPALPPSLSLSLFLVLLFTLLALPSPLERDRAFARLLLRLPPSLFHRPRIAKSIPNANRAFPRRSSFFVSFFERSLFEGIGGGSRGSRNRRRGRVLGREDGKLTKRRRERGREGGNEGGWFRGSLPSGVILSVSPSSMGGPWRRWITYVRNEHVGSS